MVLRLVAVPSRRSDPTASAGPTPRLGAHEIVAPRGERQGAVDNCLELPLPRLPYKLARALAIVPAASQVSVVRSHAARFRYEGLCVP